jgi:hypothetical protein
MINVFQLADNDQSIYYLGQIFGNVGTALSGTGPALLSQMFKVFNTIMLAIAVIIVVYVSVIGVMKTAAEGEVLGKGWSTLWVPLRTVFGVAILMPTTTGYCAAQVIIMWFIVQGVGAADMVWSTAINYFGQGGSAFAAPPPNPTDISNGATTIWTNVMQNLICQSTVTKFSQDNESAVAQTQRSTPNGQIVYSFGNASSSASGAATECGTLTLPPDGEQIYQVSYNGEIQSITVVPGQTQSVSIGGLPPFQVPSDSYPDNVTVIKSGTGSKGRQEGLDRAYQTALPTLEIIADYYVKQVIDDTNCWNQPCTPGVTACNYFNKWTGFTPNNDTCFYGPTTGDNQGYIAWDAVLQMAGSNYLLDVTKIFTGEAGNYAVNAAMEESTAVQGTSVTSNISPDLQKAQVNGWVYAGAYYYSLAGASNTTQDKYTDFIMASKIVLFNNQDPNAPDFKDLTSSDPQILITNNSKFLTTQAANALDTTLSMGGGMHSTSAGQTSSSLRDVSDTTMTQWMNLIAPGTGNPVARIQSFGHNILLAADLFVAVFFGTSMLAAALGGNYIALGFSVNYGYQMALQALSMLTTASFFLVAYMITVGGLMGVYVPLIPFVLFSMGVIGWMIVVIEAMIAGPIIALGILSPGGQNEVFSQGAASIMLTLNLMLRPTLMVFGMFSAMLLSYVAVKFINSAFYNVVGSFTSSPGMFETFLFIVAYVGLIIVALNKCFELIHHVPDRTLHWIGHQGGAGAGEAQAAQELKGKVSAGGEAGAGAGRGAGGAASGAADAGARGWGQGQMNQDDRREALAEKQEKMKKRRDDKKLSS